MWECGLKLPQLGGATLTTTSLLMWECGLKLCYRETIRRLPCVTPYVGVWIETLIL